MIKRSLYSCLFMLFCLAIISCQKEDYAMDGDFKLHFSADTISFDTIFTSVGSATKWLKVKNRGPHAVNLSNIALAGRDQSPFRLNINGVNHYQAKDVTIYSGDSIFIFVEVTIDPTGQNHPMVVQDSIVFELNGRTQDVDLRAFGQDFHFFNGQTISTQRWQNDKPYLIYNSILVDSLEILTIDPGSRIYFRKGASLFVKGTLQVQGTLKDPVTFSGDRLDKDYRNIPGQWGAWTVLDDKSKYLYGGLHFLKGSKDNVIDHAIIKNANKGIQVDSMGFSANPVLVLSNSRIENMLLNCLDARTSYLKVSNSIFANSGSYSVALLFGGQYDFYHCTIANYYNSRFSIRKEPSLIINNFYTYRGSQYTFDLASATFANCIIYGSMANEITLAKVEGKQFNYRFQNCLIKTKSPDFSKDPAFGDSMFNKDPLFTDSSKNDYSLQSASPARHAGNKDVAAQFPKDLNDYSRMADQGPDLGALEWQETEKK